MRSEAEQVETVGVTITEIMSAPTFALGAADARAGRAYHPDYDVWDTNGQWDYERGRMWASLAPPGIALKINGKLNSKARSFYPPEII